MGLIPQVIRETEGQDLIEYALLLALIAVAAIPILALVVGGVNGVFQTIIDAL